MSRVFCTPVCSAPRVRRAKGKCLRSRGHKKSHERSASDVSGDRTAEPGTRQPKAARRWQSNHLPSSPRPSLSNAPAWKRPEREAPGLCLCLCTEVDSSAGHKRSSGRAQTARKEGGGTQTGTPFDVRALYFSFALRWLYVGGPRCDWRVLRTPANVVGCGWGASNRN